MLATGGLMTFDHTSERPGAASGSLTSQSTIILIRILARTNKELVIAGVAPHVLDFLDSFSR